MSKIRVMLVVGARPQFIKSAPLISEILRRHRRVELSIIHSGQHYDPEMSEIFFHQLHIPRPMMNLEAGSGSHARQTATIMKRLEKPMLQAEPCVVIVPGDTNTTLAAALTAAKLNIPVAHIEAGLRSGDMTMPEEINRRLTDHCSSILFAPTKTANSNLRKEGLNELAYLTGDTMVDTLRIVSALVDRAQKSILERFRLTEREYVLVTMHRPFNVGDLDRLCEILHALRDVSRRLRVVFPVHPRTRSRLAQLKITKQSRDQIGLTDPLGYVEILSLLRNAKCLLTDSGGMQKESFLLHIPCVTLRSTTEWPETLVSKANQLISKPDSIATTLLNVAYDRTLRQRIKHLKNPFGDGHASARIARIIEEWVRSGEARPNRLG
ncbi:MAG: UDP-N-acetylglucosamine 2-epimerase (non-hydrolyzing) [Candidatus Bathyarchaeia archaeon]